MSFALHTLLRGFFEMTSGKVNKSASEKGKSASERDEPVPYGVPDDMYAAMRVTSLYKAFDNNPKNVLNNFANPPKIMDKTGKYTGFIMSHPNITKLWLKNLCLLDLWSEKVPIERKVTSRSGNVSVDEIRIDTYRVLRIPSDAEIDDAYNSKTARELKYAAYAITKFILQPHRKDLLPRTGDEAAKRASNKKDEVALPDTLMKIDRWEAMGYKKLAFAKDGALFEEWRLYYKQEILRLRALNGNTRSGRTKDSTLRSFTENDATQHNTAVIEAMIKGFSGAYGGATEEMMTKRLKGSAVSPTTIYEAVHPVPKSASKKKKVEQKEYVAMIERYQKLTGHRLNITREREINNYDFRMGEIEDAERIKEGNRNIKFIYHPGTNRIAEFKSSIDLSQAAHLEESKRLDSRKSSSSKASTKSSSKSVRNKYSQPANDISLEKVVYKPNKSSISEDKKKNLVYNSNAKKYSDHVSNNEVSKKSVSMFGDEEDDEDEREDDEEEDVTKEDDEDEDVDEDEERLDQVVHHKEDRDEGKTATNTDNVDDEEVIDDYVGSDDE
jgi:hypothetical protein